MGRRRERKRAYTCDDCFFRCHGLCALRLDEPCSTFRPDDPRGLVPPRQPALLLRDPVKPHAESAQGGFAPSAVPSEGGLADLLHGTRLAAELTEPLSAELAQGA
jgi:hypothetical protein